MKREKTLKKTFRQHLKWWWTTRIAGFFRVRIMSVKLSDAVSPISFHQSAADLGEPNPKGITVILNAYRRVEYLEEQIRSLRNQTVPPTEIWVWYNASPDQLQDVSALVDRVVVSNTNWLFWGRFALGSLARTEYLAFFDDDILPQHRWLENCLNTIEAGYDGILGGSGVRLPLEGGYSSKSKAGWNGQQSDEVIKVDLVGHAWFLRKKHLQYMWRQEPYSWDNGEDIHFSYMALKYGGIETFVPPHPDSDQSLWSCRPDFGKIVGRKNVATFKTSGHRDVRSKIVDAYRADGWQIVEEQNLSSTDSKTFGGDLELFNYKLLNQVNFSLVRFGDGEMLVINGDMIDLWQKCNGEHRYIPGNEVDEINRAILTESLTYQNEHYFVGLPCRCCVGDEKCDQLRVQSAQPEMQLTWANIFVNANYPVFKDKTVPLLALRKVNIICHEKADVGKLPFAIRQDFRIGRNAWTEDYVRSFQQIKDYIEESQVADEVFIFCAGVLSNMLIYQLTKKYPDNTYLDLGSVFDDVMGPGKTRKYLKGSRRRLKKVCVW